MAEVPPGWEAIAIALRALGWGSCLYGDTLAERCRGIVVTLFSK